MGIVVVFLIFVVFPEVRQRYADWKIRKVAKEREAELREAGFLK